MLNISESTCLYTGIFGGYEKLNELEGPVKKSKIKKYVLLMMKLLQVKLGKFD